MAALLAWNVVAPVFVGPSASTGLRGSRARLAAKNDFPMEFVSAEEPSSKGAVNEVALITPQVDTVGLQGYGSLTVIFMGSMMIMTAGGAIEFLRFFPDCLYW